LISRHGQPLLDTALEQLKLEVTRPGEDPAEGCFALESIGTSRSFSPISW